MKTTLDIPDDIYRWAKEPAAQQATKLKSLCKPWKKCSVSLWWHLSPAGTRRPI